MSSVRQSSDVVRPSRSSSGSNGSLSNDSTGADAVVSAVSNILTMLGMAVLSAHSGRVVGFNTFDGFDATKELLLSSS